MGESRQELVTLVTKVKEHAHIQPDRDALIFKKETLTYRELDERIAAAGELLAGMGIKKGDRVLFTAL
ncbi:MAG: AMP-binding protein, partial [Lachnospiraceae bacterium]|nr:AMP-binding protein [Lachnospiraceae bacterium]